MSRKRDVPEEESKYGSVPCPICKAAVGPRPVAFKCQSVACLADAFHLCDACKGPPSFEGQCFCDMCSICLFYGDPRLYDLAWRRKQRQLFQAYEACFSTSPDVAALAPGLEVRLQGLKMKPEMNGQEGVLLMFDEAKGRWQIKLNSGKVLEVKPENLQEKNS